jgi:4-amino-4-deoxy-L-arabinose transferase-like glycosyltransferase
VDRFAPYRRAALVAILGFGIALRAYNLAQESFWLDELGSILTSIQPWRGLWGRLMHDLHPPVYFVLLKLWGSVFGFDETGARSFSVVCGIAAIAFAYLLAARLLNQRAALFAAALVACSPYCVFYSREARPYSLLLCASLIATWLFVRAAPEFNRRPLIAYAISATLLVYTHNFGFFVLFTHVAYAFTLRMSGELDRERVRRLFAGAIAIAIAYAPWTPVVWRQIHHVERGFWIPAPDPQVWIGSWWHEGTYSIAWLIATSIAAVVALVAVWRRSRPAAVLLGGSIAAPAAIPILLSYISQPIYLGRYAIMSAACLLIGAGAAFDVLGGKGSRLRSALAALACAALVAVGTAESVHWVFLVHHKEQWRELARFAADESSRTGVPLVVTTEYAPHIKTYFDREIPIWSVGRTELAPDAPDGLARRLSELRQDRFWLLNVHPAWTEPDLEPLLRAQYVPTARREWRGAEAILWVGVDRANETARQ